MKSKISNQFFVNYIIVFFLSIIATIFAIMFFSFANDVISKTLVKNKYPADQLMKDDYTQIDASFVVADGGGVQVVNKDYEVVYTAGINNLSFDKLTVRQFTDFLIKSKSKGIPYHYDILYNEQEEFWLIVTFPTSMRFDFSFVYNKEFASKDFHNVIGAVIAVLIFYLLILAIFASIFSRITSVRITTPLRKLLEGTKRLQEGDYSARVDLQLKNEFDQLQDTFNDMAERIEKETDLRMKSEEERKKMIMNISHDLKNPLASITGYAELCLKHPEALSREQLNYLQIIIKNSQRCNHLMTELFDLSKLESSEFKLKLSKVDVCEFVRQACIEQVPMFEQACFEYEFDIPDKEIQALLDSDQMNRVFYNLTENVIRYNSKGTKIHIRVYEEEDKIKLIYMDNGIGIPSNVSINIFKPFVRVEDSRNSQTGGTGLGLSIVDKIVTMHGGQIQLLTDTMKGCTFVITLPQF